MPAYPTDAELKALSARNLRAMASPENAPDRCEARAEYARMIRRERNRSYA